MRYAKIIFSPTGGTEKVADRIAKNWQGAERVDLSAAADEFATYQFVKEDIVLIAMPSFGGLAPQVALDRLGQIKGNSARCVLVCVYGNRAYEDTLVQMEDTAEKCGFRVIAAVAAVAEHSILRQFAAGRPDEEDNGQLDAFAARISEKIAAGDETKPAIPGNRPYKKAGSLAMVPKAGEECTACGLCAKQCPVAAIDPQSPKSADKTKCISCMRCIAVCPQKTRKLNGAVLGAVSLALKKACAERKANEVFL